MYAVCAILINGQFAIHYYWVVEGICRQNGHFGPTSNCEHFAIVAIATVPLCYLGLQCEC